MRKIGVLLIVLMGLVGVASAAESSPREIEIVVENGGYNPSKVTVQEGEAVRLKFLRKEYSGCTKEVVFPSLGIKKELPVNKPVIIDIPAQKAGEVPFQCGMAMVKGSLVVTPKK